MTAQAIETPSTLSSSARENSSESGAAFFEELRQSIAAYSLVFRGRSLCPKPPPVTFLQACGLIHRQPLRVSRRIRGQLPLPRLTSAER